MKITPERLKLADQMAQEMAPKVDRNELGKVVTFYHRWSDPQRVFELLELLPDSGHLYSGRTKGYYQVIARVCRQHLINADPETFGVVLGWSFRLLTYHQTRLGIRKPGTRPRGGKSGRRRH
jgi:hypothetical protein